MWIEQNLEILYPFLIFSYLCCWKMSKEQWQIQLWKFPWEQGTCWTLKMRSSKRSNRLTGKLATTQRSFRNEDWFMTCAVSGNQESRNSPRDRDQKQPFWAWLLFPITSRPYKHCLREEFNGAANAAPFSKTAFCLQIRIAWQISVLLMLWLGFKLSYTS